MTAPDAKPLPQAKTSDLLALLSEVVVPTLAKGVLIRRPRVVGLAARFGADDRAVQRLQRLRRNYGTRPLLLSVPGHPYALILDPDDVRTVLAGAPEPFAPASSEKQSALAHFEPKVALATRGPERQVRRRFNEVVLAYGQPVHPMAAQLLAVVAAEAATLLREAEAAGELTWEQFFPAWYRVVRRVVLGEAAREDHRLTDLLAALRRRGNWAFLRPKNRRLRDALHERLANHLARAEPGSLAAVIAKHSDNPAAAPTHQVTQWLFAFDPAGMATFRALALLAAHPETAAEARAEVVAGDPQHLPLLRATVLEALRLWPTTPLVLRETTRATELGGGSLPAGTGVLIYAPFFHRDEETLSFAHRFAPDIWRDATTPEAAALIPFSMGPAQCPAKDLVPMLTSGFLAAIIARHEVTLQAPTPIPTTERLPGTLDNYRLRFNLRPAVASPGGLR